MPFNQPRVVKRPMFVEPAEPSIIEVMDEFGSAFAGPSWLAWRVYLKALFGLPMDHWETDLYTRHTGRSSAPTQRARESLALVGRRGGKSRVAGLIGLYLALFRDYSWLAPGEVGTVGIIAADRKQAGVIFGYVEGLVDSVPSLKSRVIRRTKDSLFFDNQTSVEVKTSSWRSTRGYTLLALLADESAFWLDLEGGSNPAQKVLEALRPGLLTARRHGGGLLLLTTTPYSRRGPAWQIYRDSFGKDSDVLVWKGSSESMYPDLVGDPDIAKAYAEDPVAAGAEFGAEFRSDVELFLPEETLMANVISDRIEVPPVLGVNYFGFCDPSGGSQDSFTVAVAHRAPDGHVILDMVREQKPPFSPEETIARFAADLHRYNVNQVRGDRYGGDFPRELFRKNKISYEVAEDTKSLIYLKLLPMLSDRRVELLDHKTMLSQFRNLERRVARGGHDSVDHAPRAHDDVANSVAGALVGVGTYVKPAGLSMRESGPFGARRGGKGYRSMYDAVADAY